jgi:hypothetical protein
LAVCVPACCTHDVTINEAFLLRSGSVPVERADESLIRQPLVWAIDALRFGLYFIDPIVLIRSLMAAAFVGTVLSISALGTEWYGRRVGLMSGLITATLFGLCAQVWQSDASIVLAVLPIWIVRLYARLDLSTGWRLRATRIRLVGNRAAFAAFCALVAVSILLVDHQVVLLSMLAPLLIAVPARLRPLTWFVLFLLVAAGPISLSLMSGNSAHHLLAESWAQLSSFSGQNKMSATSLLSFAGIWGPMILIGLWVTRHEALGGKTSRERLLWSWALIPPITGLLHSSLANSLIVVAGAWGLIASLGVTHAWNSLVRRIPRLRAESSRLARIGFAAAGVVCVFIGFRESTNRADRMDAVFFAQIRHEVNDREQLLVDPSIDPPRQAFALYHLSNNSRTEFPAHLQSHLFVVAAETARERLERLGRVDILLQSDADQHDGTRLTLFRIATPALATESQRTDSRRR